MDSTSNEDVALQASNEMVGNGTIDSWVTTDNDSNSPYTPPAPPLPPPTFQPKQFAPEDTSPPEPQVTANDDNSGDNNNETGDIRYKLMQIYKPKDSGPVDVCAPLPELNHSTPAPQSTMYPAVKPVVSAEVSDAKEEENTTEADVYCTSEDGENESAREADDGNTSEEENNDTREEIIEEPRVKSGLSNQAQVAEMLAAMNDSPPSTPPPVEVDGSEETVNSDTRCSTPRTAELEATNSDTRCSTPAPADSPDISNRGSPGLGTQSYPIDVYTEEDDVFETVENGNSLDKPDRSAVVDSCLTSVSDEQLPPAYSTVSTVENGQTKNNDVVDSKVTNSRKRPKVSKTGMPNNYMKLSVCACICNVLIGIVAITYAIKSKDAWREGKKAKARSNGLNALFCALFGIFSVMAIVGIVLWLEVFTDKSGL